MSSHSRFTFAALKDLWGKHFAILPVTHREQWLECRIRVSCHGVLYIVHHRAVHLAVKAVGERANPWQMARVQLSSVHSMLLLLCHVLQTRGMDKCHAWMTERDEDSLHPLPSGTLGKPEGMKRASNITSQKT